MAKRKNIGKKTRFEVFKRDKFTCQYCGQKAPDVILHIDHITPVSKGGDNSLINLVTSCRDCNLGKRDIKLDDKSAIAIERKQIEDSHEKREQIRLLFEWKKSLEDEKTYVLNKLCDYYENKFKHAWRLTESGKKTMSEILKNTDPELIMECIDIAFDRYIKLDNEGYPTEESVRGFLVKVSKIISVKKMPPVKQKLVLLRGIGRKQIYNWNDRDSIINLNYYVKALENAGYTDEQILIDIEDELIPEVYKHTNYHGFKELIENWTKQIRGWENKENN